MAHNPTMFNATAFFGDQSSPKGRQDQFWNQHSGRNVPVDPFMSNTQEYLDGWDAWPNDDEFLGDDSALQNHVTTPDIYSTNSETSYMYSSVESTPGHMDPEISSWVEEETEISPYIQSFHRNTTHNDYQPTASAQTIADKFHVTSDGLATTATYDTQSDFYQHFGPDVVPDYRTPTEASTPEILHPSTGFVNGDRFNLLSVGHPTVGDPMAGSFKSDDAANFFGQEEEQHSSAWASLTENKAGQVSTPEYRPSSGTSLPQLQLSSTESFGDNSASILSDGLTTISEPAGIPYQEIGATVVPDYEILTEASLQEVQETPDQIVNGDRFNLVGEPQATSGPASIPYQTFDPAVVPDYRTTMEAVLVSSTDVTSGDMFNVPTEPQATSESAVIPNQPCGPAAVPDYRTPTDTSLLVVQQSSHVVSDDRLNIPREPEAIRESVTIPNQPFSPAVVPDYRTPMEASMLEVQLSSTDIASGDMFNSLREPQATSEPATIPNQPFGPAVVPDYRTPTDASLLVVQQSSHIVSDDRIKIPREPQATCESATIPNQPFGPAVVPDYRKPMEASSSEVQLLSTDIASGDMLNGPWESQATCESTTIPNKPFGPALVPDYRAPTEVPLWDPPSVAHQAFAESGRGLPQSVEEPQNSMWASVETPSVKDDSLPLNQVEEISIPPQKLASSLVSDSSEQRQDPDKMAEPVADLENPSVLHQDHPVFQENGLPVQKEEVTTVSTELPEVNKLLAEPDSPRDARQVAFLQKQLAGKAPASSPCTSLWMNANTMLPTPCVLAPAATGPLIEIAERSGTNNLPPSDKQKEQPPPDLPHLVPLTDVMRLFKDTSDQAEVLETPEESDSENENPVLHNERSDCNPFPQDLTLLVQETLDAANAEAEKAMPVMSQTCPETQTAQQLRLDLNLNPKSQGQVTEPFTADMNPSSSTVNSTLPPTPAEVPLSNKNVQENIIETPPPSNVQGVAQVSQPLPVKTVSEERLNELCSQMPLATLLQGAKKQLKKKTTQVSASVTNAEPGSLQTSSNPHLASNASNLSNPSSASSVSVSSNDQSHHLSGHSSQDSSHPNQSFQSFERTESLQHSHDRDYGHSHDHPKEPGNQYHPHRRDSYYSDDERDPDDLQKRRDPYYDQERDNERLYYERRNCDRRRDYAQRENDYGRGHYDRDYDRGVYDSRGYPRRDSYDNHNSYYGRDYLSRQPYGGYDDKRSSREDLYRSSFHSGHNTPSYDSNSPYDAAYAAHRFNYPSYGDPQTMDMYQYQYLMYLYQFHPQHYEQYCAQLGYYNTGYTPEQMAQYYEGMYNTSGYYMSQATVPAPVEETPTSQPERFTPLLYGTQHPIVRFSGGRLISVIGGNETEAPRCTIASVQMIFTAEEIEVIKIFPGPLSSRYSSRTEVITFCEKRSTVISSSADGVVKSLVWKVLANLVKHNGAFVASELAEIIMENWRTNNSSAENEFMTPDSQPSSETDLYKHIQLYREMLLAGATKDALEYCMRNGLWGHAMMLAAKMDKKVHNDVITRFMKTMTDFDPIRTVYDHLSGKQPVALMTTDDWQRNLAAMVANPPRQHPQCIKKNMTCLGDTLLSNEQVWEAHLCYLLAGEQFGYPLDEDTKMSMIGINHKATPITGRHLPLENLQMMEVFEYAVSLSNEEHHIPVLQNYKFLHLQKMLEAGFTEEALHYAELIGQTIIKHPTNANIPLVKSTKEMIDRLNHESEEAIEMIDMLDKVLQARNSSQISSVTESESEAEEPLAESSASYFSGYEHSSNTPKHQADTADVQSQGSIVEPLDSLAQVQQEAVTAESLSSSVVASIARESWSEETEAQVTQPELPPVMPAQAPEPPQPSYYAPSPPLNQPSFGPVKSQQPETVEEQHFYGSQWTEPAQVDEAQQVEPIQPREPEPVKKEEEKPKAPEKKKKESKRGSPIGGWLSGLLSKVMPRGPNEMILPDDTKKSIYWDENLKRWVNTDEDEQDKTPPPPPPSDMQLGAGRSPMMPIGNVASAGATTRGLGGPVSTPFSPPSVQAPGIPEPVRDGEISAAPPSVSKFSRKAYGGGRLGKKYVDVLNPSGQTANGPAMLPNSFLPSFPGPVNDFNPAQLFVPAPVPAGDASDTFSSAEPVVANPGSRPSSPHEFEDGSDQHSQHSRSSSVSLTSAEVRSYMMPQVPDAPPQNMAPVFYDPSSFNQSKAQGTPRKSRYPGPIRK
ncbi:protein transport protein Sec16A-like isoform X2 [Montipora foliosa]|uniref:protein transport protein Sec16A-like isoform X2 n=1 Tax=Montipora foliosa TaxID=591990 RepID=UPI0035F1D61A